MIDILLKSHLPTDEDIFALGRAMQLTHQEIESYLQKNREDIDNVSGSVEIIQKWWRSLKDEVNQVAAMCELMVKANMKPQADKFYDICDRIRNAETLETLKGMIKDAPPANPSTANVTNHEDIVIKTFDECGGRLYLENYDVSLQIPFGALERGTSRQIALKVLTRTPLPLDLGEKEIIASLGFQCFPSGTQV